MGNRTKSQDQKIVSIRRETDTLYARAREIYRQRHPDPSGEGSSKGDGYRAICKEVSDAHFSKTGQRLCLSPSTLQRHVQGGMMKSQANARKGWLREEETELIVCYAIDMAERGFPLKLKELQCHAEDILHARLGDDFPATGLGKHWAERFVRRHSDRLQRYLSRGLDKKRAKNVNPATHQAWFTLLAETITNFNIEEDCIYGSDEVGFLLRAFTRAQVIGPVNQKIQYDCAPENRENATVLCTICGDGSSVLPLVIFKGRHYFASWGKANANNFMIGRSISGWITGEIGVEWIKHFDRLTQKKANGRARLLLVDGHASHYTVQFLQHARENNIHILCYPSHATHVYQGLDVAIFSPLKLYYQDELRNFERQGGGRVTKEVFMTLYSNAHAKAFVAGNIKVAWAKTGVIPLNPNAIKATAFKTSLETTIRPGALPLAHIQSTPTRLVIGLLAQARQVASSPTSASEPIEHAQELIENLKTSELGFLLNSETLTPRARQRLPRPAIMPVTPGPSERLRVIRAISPVTDKERVLQGALEAMADKLADQGKRINTLEATMILHETYVNKLQAQLNRKVTKSDSRRRLLGDGLPVLLSGEEFYTRAKEHQRKREAEEKRKILAVQARRVYTEEMKLWKNMEDERKERNKTARAAYSSRLKDWDMRKAIAKASKIRFTEARPLRGPFEKAHPKPRTFKTEQLSSEVEGEEYFNLDAIGSDDDEDEEGTAFAESTFRLDDTVTIDLSTSSALQVGNQASQDGLFRVDTVVL